MYFRQFANSSTSSCAHIVRFEKMADSTAYLAWLTISGNRVNQPWARLHVAVSIALVPEPRHPLVHHLGVRSVEVPLRVTVSMVFSKTLRNSRVLQGTTSLTSCSIPASSSSSVMAPLLSTSHELNTYRARVTVSPHGRAVTRTGRAVDGPREQVARADPDD